LPASIALVALDVFVVANTKSFEMLLLSHVILTIGSCTGFVGAGYIGGQWLGMAKFSLMFGLVQVVAALTSALSQNAIESRSSTSVGAGWTLSRFKRPTPAGGPYEKRTLDEMRIRGS
jgi:hypothetical protein